MHSLCFSFLHPLCVFAPYHLSSFFCFFRFDLIGSLFFSNSNKFNYELYIEKKLRIFVACCLVFLCVCWCISLPVCHARFIQCHKVYLTRRTSFGTAEKYLIISFTQKLKTLSFFMHKNAIQMARFHRTYL